MTQTISSTEEETFEDRGWICRGCGAWHPADHACQMDPKTGDQWCAGCKPRLGSLTIVGVLHPGGMR
jgi:hypothetical protein